MSRMPIIFVGHGSPMNAIEDNSYTRAWRDMAKRIPRPNAILSISAHWFTKGTRILNAEQPKTVYDMYGFPKELYEVVYDSPGSPGLASRVKELITKEAEYDNSWGIDHGTWSVLTHMYPDRDIPVIQVSVDGYAPPKAHYQLGKELGALRDEGVLILGSGNIVHSLRLIDWDMVGKGFEWANQFDDDIYHNIVERYHENILNYMDLGEAAKLSVPTPDHFYPLLYILGASVEEDNISCFNKFYEMGSLSMTGYLFE